MVVWNYMRAINTKKSFNIGVTEGGRVVNSSLMREDCDPEDTHFKLYHVLVPQWNASCNHLNRQ